MAYTLNPEDKYLTPKPSVRTRSRDQDIEVSSLERSHNESTVRSKTFPETRLSCDSPIRPVTVIRATSCISTSDRHSSYSEPPVRRKPFWASLGRLRQVRSAGTDRRIEELYQGCPSEPGTETGTSCSRSADSFEFSKGLNSARTISRISRVTPNSNGAPKEHSAPFVEQKIANSSLCPDPASLTHLETVEDKGHGAMPLNELSKQVRDLCREQTPVRPDDSSQTPGGRVNDLETSTLNLYEPISLAHYEAQEQKPWRTQLGDEYPDQPGALSSIELGDQFDLSSSTTCDLERQLSVSDSSYSSSDIFSPSSSSATAYSNCMSPFHLSQPETPTTGEFEEYSLGFSLGKITTSLLPTCEEDDAGLQDLPSGRAQSNTAHLNISGFQGYTQPKEEYGSALTLRNLSPKSSRGEPSLDQKSGQNLVESWNDGVEDRIAAMDDLLDDLSYLGGMIA
ncbi:hypothetical protein MMC20_000466 [Loxospora ochrophaea]|nr:hypothetical protein [Loxospora ochrophaea]